MINVINDIKNFKDISIIKKIIYIAIVLFIVLLILGLFTTTKKAKTVESDNFYGMRFNLKIEDFCEIYNKNLKEISKNENMDIGSDSVLYFKKSMFEKQSTKHKQSGLDMYIATMDFSGMKLGVVFYTEPNTDYIVGTNLMPSKNYYNNNTKTNSGFVVMVKDLVLASMVKTLYPQVKYANQMFNNCTEANYNSYFLDNIEYKVVDNSVSQTYDFMIMATSERKYKELYSQNAITKQNSDNEYKSSTNSSQNNNTSNSNTSNTTNSTNNNYNNNTSNSNVSANNETTNSQNTYTKYYLEYNGREYNNIYIELKGNNIYLYDNQLELYFAGTYTVNNNFITGSYKKVKYNNGGDIMTIDCNDEFEFQILSTNQIQDKLGYYSYVDGQVMYRNAVYNNHE